ncbi:MAG: hypothetical protein BWX79_01100 [Alphaproteobacteria bacterium ADurb.Bin100]|nr:MAG: hypothetical protein BWX79_01100 [Alphaproteobacteria bacterium ADurb.Bin100]
MLAHAHAPEDHGGLGGGVGACHLANRLSRNAADWRHGLGAVALHVGLQRLELVHALTDEGLVDQALGDDDVQHRVEQGHVGVCMELQHPPGVAGNVGAPRVGQHQPGTPAHSVLDPRGAHRVVGRGVGADDEDEIGMLHVPHRVAHRAGAHAFEQRGHTGGMAQAGAVVHVVAAKAGAHQLLEQVGLFVAALGGAETRQRLLAVCVAQGEELARREVQCLVPAGLAEDFAPVQVAVQVVGVLGHAGLADQWLRQARRVVRVIEAEAALDAEASVIGRAGAAVHRDDFFITHFVGDLAADAAEGANRVHRAVHLLRAAQRLGHQRTGGAGLHTLTASHAAAGTHGVGQVEHHLRVRAAKRQADDVVALRFAAGALTAVALDAGVEVDRHRGM